MTIDRPLTAAEWGRIRAHMKTVRLKDCYDADGRISSNLRTKLGRCVKGVYRGHSQGLSEELTQEALKWATATLTSESDSG